MKRIILFRCESQLNRGNSDASSGPDPFRARSRRRAGRRLDLFRQACRPDHERIIARDIVWNCGAGACQGATDESRPAVLCQSLARRAGKVDSFLADGRAFTPAELDKCNASAKTTPARRSPPNNCPRGRCRSSPPRRPPLFRACTIAPHRPILGGVLRQYELVEKVRSYDPDADEGLINRAYVFSMKAHGVADARLGRSLFQPSDRGRGHPHRPEARRPDDRHRDPPRHDRGHAGDPAGDREAFRQGRRAAGRRRDQAQQDRGAVGERARRREPPQVPARAVATTSGCCW